MPKLYFDPVARLQRYLGKELIADPNLAIIEFVKNAYDAHASKVTIHFDINNRERQEQAITITDNGIGMDLDSFKENWLHPGYSGKAKQITALRKGTKSGVQRVPTGEKGLGRLAAGRLGDRIDILTRSSKAFPWLYVRIDWEQFNTMDELLRKIPIQCESILNVTDIGISKGTKIVITGLSVDWASRIPGRRVMGRSYDRLGRLAEDLNIVMQPIPKGQREFKIFLSSDSENLKKYNREISPLKYAVLDYEFEVKVSEGKNGIFIERIIRRGEEIVNLVHKPSITEQKGYINQLYKAHEAANLPKDLVCGPFSGSVCYSPLSTRRLKELNITPGVFLYRDGVRVEPYGQEGNDWLGALAWKASRQGYAPVQPSHLTGYFTISHIPNPDLNDMSNRQGLVDNEAYQTFLSITRSEFRWFGDLVLDEYVRPKWETIAQKVQKVAQGKQTFGVQLIRSIAHSVGQSTAGLGAELKTIEQSIEQLNGPSVVKEQLRETIGRSWKHVDRIDETIQRFLKFDQEALLTALPTDEFVLRDVVENAISQTKTLADTLHVAVLSDKLPSYSVRFNKEILVTALAELISNAIEASHSVWEEGGGEVRISLEQPDNKNYSICVEDNGPGLPASSIDELIAASFSTKGRPGSGLMLTSDAIAFAGGRMSLRSKNGKGSGFEITIPIKASM